MLKYSNIAGLNANFPETEKIKLASTRQEKRRRQNLSKTTDVLENDGEPKMWR